MSAYARQLATLSDAIIAQHSESMLAHIKRARMEVIAPETRLGIYTHGYTERLLKAVRADYPALAHYFGEEHLTQAIRAYIRATPSRSWDLNKYPAGFGAFFAAEARDRAAAALAALEGAIAEVFWLPESEPLAPGILATFSSETFAATRVTPRAALTLLAANYATNTYLQAFRDGHPLSAIAKENEYLCVVRHGNEVKRLVLAPAEYTLLTALFQGASFGEALERTDRLDLAKELPHYLARWFTYGMFAA